MSNADADVDVDVDADADADADAVVTAIALPVLTYRRAKKDRIKNNREKVETSFSPLKVNGGFLLPWKPEF